MIGVHQRLRPICIEHDSTDAEHSPRAWILLGESDPERETSLFDIERGSAFTQRRDRIERKRRDRDAISGYCVERRPNSAEEREAFDECRIDDARMRGNLIR